MPKKINPAIDREIKAATRDNRKKRPTARPQPKEQKGIAGRLNRNFPIRGR